MNELLVLLLLCAAVSALVALLAGYLRPRWSLRSIAALVGAIIPVPLALLCLWVIVGALMSSRESCGVDACGMAVMFGTIGLFWALLGFALGYAVAWSVLRFVVRR